MFFESHSFRSEIKIRLKEERKYRGMNKQEIDEFDYVY